MVHQSKALLWFLLLGDSGVGKSKVRGATARLALSHVLSRGVRSRGQGRGIGIKAMNILAANLKKEGEALGLPHEMIERGIEAARSFTADPTAAGILNMADKAGIAPAKLVVRARMPLRQRGQRGQRARASLRRSAPFASPPRWCPCRRPLPTS